MRPIVLRAATALLLSFDLLSVVSCRQSQLMSPSSFEIPAPPWINDVKRAALPDGRSQLSFVADEAYPSSRVRDFYDSWATGHGWERASKELEALSADEWVSFRDPYDVKTDMWTVHWRSPDLAQSLRLVLLHRGDRGKQEVFVVLSPYDLVDSEVKTLGEYMDEWEKNQTEGGQPPPK